MESNQIKLILLYVIKRLTYILYIYIYLYDKYGSLKFENLFIMWPYVSKLINANYANWN